MVWWRVLRVAADATAALVVWALVRRDAGHRWALAGWLAAAVTIAQPTSANPFPVALALALVRRARGARRGRPVAAGLLAALAAFWRPDIGVVAALAAVAALLAAAAPAARRGRRTRRWPAPRAARGRTALAAGVALYAPFAVAAGPGRLWDALVGIAAGDGDAWRLPFPLDYDGPLRGWPPSALAEDLKDVLGFYLPLRGARAGRRRARRAAAPPAPAVAGARRLLVLASAARSTCSRAPTSCTRSRCSSACAR